MSRCLALLHAPSACTVLNAQRAHKNPMLSSTFINRSAELLLHASPSLVLSLTACTRVHSLQGETRGHSIVMSSDIPKHDYIFDHDAHARTYVHPSRAQTPD